jgi:hypothetical protein
MRWYYSEIEQIYKANNVVSNVTQYTILSFKLEAFVFFLLLLLYFLLSTEQHMYIQYSTCPSRDTGRC